MTFANFVAALALVGLGMVSVPTVFWAYSSFNWIAVTVILGGVLLLIALILSSAIVPSVPSRGDYE